MWPVKKAPMVLQVAVLLLLAHLCSAPTLVEGDHPQFMWMSLWLASVNDSNLLRWWFRLLWRLLQLKLGLIQWKWKMMVQFLDYWDHHIQIKRMQNKAV
jgi:hypothetical protein